MTLAHALCHMVAAVLVAMPRLCGHKSQAYQAAAHLYVGGMAVAWWITRTPLYVGIVVGLSLVEIACFLIFRDRATASAKGTHR